MIGDSFPKSAYMVVSCLQGTVEFWIDLHIEYGRKSLSTEFSAAVYLMWILTGLYAKLARMGNMG